MTHPPVSSEARFVSVPRPLMALQPVTLEGALIRLEPLRLSHHAALSEVGLEPEIWRYFPKPILNEADMRDYIQSALKGEADQTMLPFVTILQGGKVPIGSTRFMNIDRVNYRAEIGSTWINPRWQRTGVNTEAKYLMLRHAFEQLGCIRVEFKTDSLNSRSRQAILRLGAVEEGLFRNHMIMHDGRLRHSVYFSITDEEWHNRVKAHMETLLKR